VNEQKREPILVNAVGLADLLSLSRSSIHNLRKSGKLPAPVNVSIRAPRWSVDDVRAWTAAGCPDAQTWAKRRHKG